MLKIEPVDKGAKSRFFMNGKSCENLSNDGILNKCTCRMLSNLFPGFVTVGSEKGLNDTFKFFSDQGGHMTNGIDGSKHEVRQHSSMKVNGVDCLNINTLGKLNVGASMFVIALGNIQIACCSVTDNIVYKLESNKTL